jgi:hypothetical protein
MNISIRKILYRNSDLLKKNKVKLNKILTVNQKSGANKLTVEYNQHKYIYEESLYTIFKK